MNRRGEMSMEVIIIAAIALLVLVILAVLILRSGGNVSEGTSCTSASVGGQCADKDANCEDVLPGSIPGTYAGCAATEKCCIPLK